MTFSEHFDGLLAPAKKLAAVALVATAGLLAVTGPGGAVTVSCPGTAATNDREFRLTTTTASTCLAYAPNNLNGNNDAINALGYLTLDKSDDTTTGPRPNALSAGLTSGLSGTFSFVAAGFSNFVIAFKSGNGQLNPDWAAFLLPAGVTSGSWSISGQQQLSHVNLYGVHSTTAPVPLPAAGLLLLGGLGGLGLVFRRRA